MKSSVKFKKSERVSFIFNQRKQIVINRCHTQHAYILPNVD